MTMPAEEKEKKEFISARNGYQQKDKLMGKETEPIFSESINQQLSLLKMRSEQFKLFTFRHILPRPLSTIQTEQEMALESIAVPTAETAKKQFGDPDIACALTNSLQRQGVTTNKQPSLLAPKPELISVPALVSEKLEKVTNELHEVAKELNEVAKELNEVIQEPEEMTKELDEVMNEFDEKTKKQKAAKSELKDAIKELDNVTKEPEEMTPSLKEPEETTPSLKEPEETTPSLNLAKSDEIESTVLPELSLKIMPSSLNILPTGVVLSRYVNEENCHACGGFQVTASREQSQWIFCKSCGESFHMSCAPDAPSIDHPTKINFVKLDEYHQWEWDCRACRQRHHCCADNTTITGGELIILRCFECGENWCKHCAPELELSDSPGYYYRCTQCTNNKPTKCLHCKKEGPLINHLFCSACDKHSSCPICHVRYDDNDYSVEMVGCSLCDAWTHAACIGLDKKQYKKLGKLDIPFYCVDCQPQMNSFLSTLENPDDVVCCFECGKGKDLLPLHDISLQTINLEDSDSLLPTIFVHKHCKKVANNPDTLDMRLPAKSSCYQRQVWVRRGILAIGASRSYMDRDPSHTTTAATVDTKSFSAKELRNLQKQNIHIKIHTWNRQSETQGTRSIISFDINISRRLTLKTVDLFIDNGPKTTFRNMEAALESVKENFSQPFRSKIKSLDLQKLVYGILRSLYNLSSRSITTPIPSKPKIIRKITLKHYKVKPKQSKLQIEPEDIEIEYDYSGTCAKSREYNRTLKAKGRNLYYAPIVPHQSQVDALTSTRTKEHHNAHLKIAKSKIAGFGLYTSRPIPMHSLIIEYCGEVISQRMADRRELLYNLIPLRRYDCYLFRLAANCIIDATKKGNVARFINHSCDPNCQSWIEKNKIVIIAARDIEAGEELTYDYKFSQENADDTVPCACKSRLCRGYMN